MRISLCFQGLQANNKKLKKKNAANFLLFSSGILLRDSRI